MIFGLKINKYDFRRITFELKNMSHLNEIPFTFGVTMGSRHI